MKILGLGFTDHETSAALVIDGRLRHAIARERLTRIKRDGKLWGSRRMDLTQPLLYCLEEHGLGLNDVDLIVWSHVDHIPATQVLELLKEEGSIDLSSRPFVCLPHHFAHACCTYYLSPLEEAAILVADGSGGPLSYLKQNCAGPEPEALANGTTILQNLKVGLSERGLERESFYHFDGATWKVLRKIIGNRGGIGSAYGSASEFLFGDCLDAGKTMGLAPYGRPHPTKLFLEVSGTDSLTTFGQMNPPERDSLEEEIDSLRSMGQSLAFETPLLCNFAASIQHETEEALLAHARWLQGYTGSKHLCLSGGLALNCVANSRIAQEAGFDEVFVPPYPGDDGIAVGCALYGASLSDKIERATNSVFLGRSYTHDPSALAAVGLVRVFERLNTFDTIAREIANGAVVAWFQGGAELGPRALGHRSFLVDPRRSEMKDHINSKIKNREPFRPFAPVVLAEVVSDFFVEAHPSHFMSFTATVREEIRPLIPAVTHVDATARYQVLRKQDNPQLYQLITAFAHLTGLPMLLNTSFNRAGEPLVETPMQAARCTIASSADYLVLDGSIYAPVFKRRDSN